MPKYENPQDFEPVFSQNLYSSTFVWQDGGDWLFGENEFEIIPNGFHTELFEFDEEERKRVKKELDIEDKLVIGHIGRFNEQKNQEYLIKTFEQVAKVCGDAVLLLVGTGPNFNRVKGIIDNSLYKNQIILYGVTKETRAMYSAMDVFVLPSRYESLRWCF